MTESLVLQPHNKVTLQLTLARLQLEYQSALQCGLRFAKYNVFEFQLKDYQGTNPDFPNSELNQRFTLAKQQLSSEQIL